MRCREMWFLRLAVLSLVAAESGANLLFATVEDWSVVSAAAIAVRPDGNIVSWEPNVTEAELRDIFDTIWVDIQKICPSLPTMNNISQHIDVGFDDALLQPGKHEHVLGWAARTEILVDGAWQGVLATDDAMRWATAMGYDHFGTLRVARRPPGGWYRRSNGTCTNRFRLQDTILHEMLHLLGVSSSVRMTQDGGLEVGSPFQGQCYPGAFDAAITDLNGRKVVSAKCAFRGSIGDRLFVEGVELYTDNDGTFMSGTSLSHLLSEDALLTATQGACEPDGARRLTNLDARVLGALGVQCNADAVFAVGSTVSTGLPRTGGPYTAGTQSDQPVSASGRIQSQTRLRWLVLWVVAWVLSLP